MTDKTDQNEIMRLLAGQQRRLYGYVLTLITDPVAADDILQQTNLVVLQKADEFEVGTNFNAWASKIAYFQEEMPAPQVVRIGNALIGNWDPAHKHPKSENRERAFNGRIDELLIVARPLALDEIAEMYTNGRP